MDGIGADVCRAALGTVVEPTDLAVLQRSIGDPPRPNEPEAVDVDEIVANTQAKDHHLFAGKVDKSRLGFGERAVMLALRAVEGDYRDWNEIEVWASGIVQELQR